MRMELRLLRHSLMSACLASSAALPVACRGPKAVEVNSAVVHGPVLAAGPDCSGPHHWAASMAFVHLKNAGLIADGGLDTAKTTAVRIASEPLESGRYRQVHRVSFTMTTGETIQAITVNDAIDDECSGSGVHVYVIGRELGDTAR